MMTLVRRPESRHVVCETRPAVAELTDAVQATMLSLFEGGRLARVDVSVSEPLAGDDGHLVRLEVLSDDEPRLTGYPPSGFVVRFRLPVGDMAAWRLTAKLPPTVPPAAAARWLRGIYAAGNERPAAS